MSVENGQLDDPGHAPHRGARLSPQEMRAEIGKRVSEPGAVRERRATPRKPKTGNPLSRLFSGLFRRRVSGASIEREKCCIVSVLMLLDRSLALDGLVLELGAETLLFRQGASFILDRTGAEVSIRFSEFDRRGRISASSEHGYLIELLEPMKPYELGGLLSQHGIRN
jgi:hypothetical protein